MSIVIEREYGNFLTAIELNSALKKVPMMLNPMGTCVSHIIEFRRDRDISNSDNDDESGNSWSSNHGSQNSSQKEDDGVGDDDLEKEKDDKKKRIRSVKYNVHNFVESVKKNVKAASTVFYSSNWSSLFEDAKHTVSIDTIDTIDTINTIDMINTTTEYNNFKYEIDFKGCTWNNKKPDLAKLL